MIKIYSVSQWLFTLDRAKVQYALEKYQLFSFASLQIQSTFLISGSNLLCACVVNSVYTVCTQCVVRSVYQQIDQAFLAAQKFLLIQYFIIPLSDDDYVLRCNELSVKHCWTTCQSELAVEFLINNFDKCPTTPVAVCRDCFEQEAFLPTLFCFSDI